MSTTSDKSTDPRLDELAHKTGLVLRSTDAEAVDRLFDKLGEYDAAERADTFSRLRTALNDSRISVGADPVYAE